MNRVKLLEDAINITGNDRNKEYGEPWVNLTNIAELWQAYLVGKTKGRSIGNAVNNYQITAEDVAWLNVQQKIARTFFGEPKPDTYIDAAAYSAIAGECASEEEAL
jgi:hypothetical protein